MAQQSGGSLQRFLDIVGLLSGAGLAQKASLVENAMKKMITNNRDC